MAKNDNDRSSGGGQDRAKRVRNKLREGAGAPPRQQGLSGLPARLWNVLKSPAGRTWGLNLATAVALSLLTLYPDTIAPTPTTYAVGDIAREDIRAPKDFPVVDEAATSAKREEAREAVLAVYDFDSTARGETLTRLSTTFAEFRNLYTSLEMQGLLPPKETGVTDLIPPTARGRARQGANPPPPLSPEEYALVVKDTQDKETAYREQLGIELDAKTLAALKADRFSETAEKAISMLVTPLFDAGIVSSPDLLKQEVGKGIKVRQLPLPQAPKSDDDKDSEPPSTQESVRKDLNAIKGLDEARATVNKSARKALTDMPVTLRRAVVTTAQALLQVNLTFNKSETEARKNAAAEETKAIFFQVKQGEIIVRSGDRITPDALARINALGDVAEAPKGGLVFLGTVILLALGMAVVYTFAFRGIRKFAPSLRDLAVMAGLGVGLLGIVKGVLLATAPEMDAADLAVSPFVFLVPIAAGPMLIRLLINFEAATIFTLILAPAAGYMVNGDPFITMFVVIGGLMAAGEVAHCKQRSTLLRAGFVVGVANVVVLLARALITDTFVEMNPDALWALGYGMAGGVLAGIIVLALTPVLEALLGYSTDIKLLELSSHENTLLKELIYRAPGTYQHSIMVGTLAEAAAEAIAVNPLLTRVMALYHDVGKMINAPYFAENQRDGKNPHSKLSPSLSSRVITAHVKDGIELARQHKLPEVVIEGIPGHHGTRLIKYFYEKALQDGEHIDETDFRYPGPKPHTREAGIMMLADSVEAASRSLKDPTPARIQQVVTTMINTIFADGQLDECELTLRDMNKINGAFFRVLSNVYHQRPEYPGTPFARREAGTESSENADGEDSGENKPKPPQQLPPGGPGVRPEEPPGLLQEAFAVEGPDDADSPRIWKH